MPSWMPSWDLLLMYRIDLLGKEIEAASHLIRTSLRGPRIRKMSLGVNGTRGVALHPGRLGFCGSCLSLGYCTIRGRR